MKKLGALLALAFCMNANAQYTDLVDFAGTANGSQPIGSLMQASNGMLYGMTCLGGANNIGVIFQYNPSTSTYTKKLDFAGATNGSNPYGSLMQASDGMLYGMTAQGGANNVGVLFQYNPSTSTYTKKLDFAGATNGQYPYGSLMQASDGMLYGMTQLGGANDFGVLFQYNPTTSTYTKKLDFAGATNGSYPEGSLMQASDGMLYGMTQNGGANGDGVLFQYNPATSTYTKKLDFAGATNGSNPFGSLIQASDGMLYGMTQAGGANDIGVIFQYNPSTSTYTKQLDFAGATNGQYPFGSLIQASNGMLYGVTDGGGANGKGVLFKFCSVLPTVAVNSATVCAGATATLTASGVTTYSWSPATGLSATTGSAVAATPTVTTTYTITGSMGTCTNSAIGVVTVNQPTSATISPVGCSSVIVNATTYTTTGVYTQTLQNVAGCDSVLTINATINVPTTATITPSGCNLVVVNATTYTATGVYTQTLTNKAGCDSILTINATIKTPTTATISPVACSSVTVNATTYTATGTYIQTLTNKAGCDSILTINATIKTPTSATVSPLGCVSVTVNATTYTATGVYTQTLTNKAGCDSTLTIMATVNMPTTATISPVGCSSVTVNATTYTTSGTYTQTFTNSVGCDSTLTINATVNPLPTLTVTASSATVCAGNTATLTVSGANTYTWSTTQTGATIAITPTVTTTYTVTGTDINDCSNTSTIMEVFSNCLGIEEITNSSEQVTVYPNPNNGTFVITKTANTQNILVTDVLGNELLSINPNGTTTTNVNLSAQPSGVYFIKVMANGTQTVKRIIINN